MKNMLILSGCSGSGKSTLAKKIKEKFDNENEVFWILSTDEFWGKEYNFDAKKLGQAHQWNQKRCKDLCEIGRNVIIDNTNLTFKEIEVYLDIAKEFGYWVSSVRPANEWSSNPSECFNKNVHSVPQKVIEAQCARQQWNLQEQITRYMIDN